MQGKQMVVMTDMLSFFPLRQTCTPHDLGDVTFKQKYIEISF